MKPTRIKIDTEAPAFFAIALINLASAVVGLFTLGRYTEDWMAEFLFEEPSEPENYRDAFVFAYRAITHTRKED